MKKYILLIVALLSVMGVKAQVNIDGIYYNLYSDYAELYGDATGNLTGVVTIPSSVTYEGHDYSVTNISAWNNNNNKVSLVLPETMTTNVNLQNISSEVATLTLPSTLVSVSFSGSVNIKEFALSSDNANFSVVDGVLFNKAQTQLICYPQHKSGVQYVVPDGVTEIGSHAFYQNPRLETVVLPDGLLSIGNNAFSYIYTLNECNLPSSLTTIGNEAFRNCKLASSNNTFTLPGNLQSVGAYAFHDAFYNNSLTTVVFPSTLGASGSHINVSNWAFNCNIIRSEITDPTHSDDNAFADVTSIYIPYGTKAEYEIKTGWNYNGSSKLREAANPSAETVAAVTITPVLNYENKTVSATLATTTEGATIRWRLNNDKYDNTDISEWNVLTDNTISVVGPNDGSTYYLRAVALKDGMNTSDITVQQFYYNDYCCNNPTITCAENSTTMTMSCNDPEASIYYTIDGSDPTSTESATCFLYNGTIDLTTNGNVTYRAIVAKDGKFPSGIESRSVTWFPVEPVQTEQVIVDGQPCLKLTTATEGAEIWWSYNWYQEDFRYDKPILAREGSTIYYMAKKQGLNSTDWKSYQLDYSGYTRCEQPTVSLDNETRKVTLTTTEERADIWYLIDSDNDSNKFPTANTNSGSTKYDGQPFTPWKNGQLKVITAKDGKINSEIYQIGLDELFRLQNVTFEPVLGDGDDEYKLGFTYSETGISDVEIYYRWTGQEETKYAGTPVVVPKNAYVYAYAKKTGYINSYTTEFNVTDDKYTVSQPNVTQLSTEKKLRVSCETKGVTIYYTKDGTNPTVESPDHFEINESYTPDVDVKLNGTFKFMAVKAGLKNSGITTVRIDDWYRVPQVTITPYGAFDYSDNKEKLMIKIDCENSWDYKIYWATNDNVDMENVVSNTLYNGPTEIKNDSYIYATAYKEGYQSNWATSGNWIYTSNYTCPQPAITVNSENVVTISCSQEGASIRYTIDGTDPSRLTGTEYKEPFTIEKNMTIKAVAYTDDMLTSSVRTRNHSNFSVQDITFAQKLIDGQPKMELSTETEGATIYYNLNSHTREDAIEYKAPVALNDGQWIYAFGVKDGYNDTGWTEARMDASAYDERCASPSADLNSETRKITLSTTEEGAEIYYIIDTADGKMPSKADGIRYDGTPFTPASNGTLRAVTIKEDKVSSSIESWSLNDIFRLHNVTFVPQIIKGETAEDTQYKMMLAYRDATIANTQDVEIYYWDDSGDEKLYKGEAFDVPLNSYLHTCAKKAGYVDSWSNSIFINEDTYVLRQPSIQANTATKKLTVTWEDEDATVWWTNNGADPTEDNSTKYTKWWHPDIDVTGNATYKFMTVKENMNNSVVYTYNIGDWFRVPEVKIIPYGENNDLKIRLECEGSYAIYWAYTDNVNRDVVTSNSLYSGPFTAESDRYITATAYKEGYSTNWRETYLYRGDYICSEPGITINNDTIVTMSSNEEGAKIRYTLDGTDPTLYAGTEYKAAFKLTTNAEIKAIAYKEGKMNSNIHSYTYSGFRVKQVSITPYVADNKLMARLETSTPGAKIYYALNNRNSTVTANIPYTAPFEIPDGSYVYANAVKENFTEAGWSGLEWVNYNNYTSSEPVITIMQDATVIMSSDETATIYYTLDGTNPTATSNKYTEPFQLTSNASIRAIAMETGKMNSNIARNDYNNFYVMAPEFSLDGTKMTITTETPGATIYYSYESEGNTLNTSSHKYTGPFELKDNSMLRAYAVRDGWNDSGQNNYWPNSVVACPQVEMASYDGHYMTLKAIDGATIWYSTNGNDPFEDYNHNYDWIKNYSAPIEVDGIGQIKAVATKNYMNRSEVATFTIEYYAGETGTKLLEPGSLESAMSWSDPKTITTFNIEGPLNQADLKFIKEKMTSLEILDMSATVLDDGVLPDNAFSGLPIISFTSPGNVNTVGNGIFTNCPELAAVVWNSTTKLPDNSFDTDKNPNLLLYLVNESAAPSRSVVDNQIINGTAQSITLVDADNINFHCPQQFYAQNINYTHQFTMTTGNGCGWETIALPFTVSTFTHETKGDLLPFTVWEEKERPEGSKPFWLRQLGETEFVDASTIEANKPYIISMPNNNSYATRFRLGGNVTFSATNVYVPVTNPQSATKYDVTLTPNFRHKDQMDGFWALNIEADEDHLPGSAFLNNIRPIRTFEAYATSKNGARRAIRIDEEVTGIRDIEMSGHLVEGNVVKVYNLQGNLVTTGTKDDVMKKLPKGVYIINGKKQMVK